MDSPNPAPPSSARPPQPSKGTFHHLQYVIGVALVLATLFTAWTPGSSFFPSWFGSSVTDPTQLLIETPTPPPAPRETEAPILSQPLIGIVSGHWGNDSGSVCADGYTEAELNQTIASLVQKQLVEQGYQVDLLKEFDERLNDYRATVLVSIHADSCDFINDAATGYKVASALASPNSEQATRLASCLRARYGQYTQLPVHSTSVTRDMTDYHAFNEINENTVAAIVEVGFMNLDRQYLTQNPEQAAGGIVSGILCYLNNEDAALVPTLTAPAPQATP